MPLHYASEAAMRQALKLPSQRAVRARSPAPPAPASPEGPAALTAFLRTLEGMAVAYGWAGQWSWNPQGEDAGLHVLLVRGTAILYVEIPLPGQGLTVSQERAAVRWDATGKVEVYTWTPKDLIQIRERLSAPA